MMQFLIEPLVGSIFLALAALGILSSIRFSLSEAYLESYAESVRAGKIQATRGLNAPGKWVALYHVSRTDLLPDGTVRLLTSRYGLADMAGFVYAASNPPPAPGEDHYTWMRDQWWHWHESW